MEEFPKPAALQPERALVHTEDEKTHRAGNVSPEAVKPPIPEDTSYKINMVKERLLEAGGVTIEPIQGDPFILSRNHMSTGEGVTTYHPDGSIQKTSIEEYQAQLAVDRKAARFFNQTQQDKTAATKAKASGAVSWWRNFFSQFG
ncbi:hypothetical protein BH11PAT2_BH11PAT2_02410 [soil metagenome]